MLNSLVHMVQSSAAIIFQSSPPSPVEIMHIFAVLYFTVFCVFIFLLVMSWSHYTITFLQLYCRAKESHAAYILWYDAVWVLSECTLFPGCRYERKLQTGEIITFIWYSVDYWHRKRRLSHPSCFCVVLPCI